MSAISPQQPELSRRAHWNNQLERHASVHPERAAIRFEGVTTTWAGLRRRVHALAGALARRGVSSGDRVALIMGNRPEFIETMLAANLLGAIAVPVNFRLAGPEAAYILDDSGAVVLVADPIGRPVAAAALGHAVNKPVVVVTGDSPDPFGRYEDLIAEPGEPHVPGDVPEDSPALIMYTSGTTGNPKGAVLTYLNLQAQALTAICGFQYHDEDDTVLIASPLFHIAGIGSCIPVFLLGGTSVIMPTGAFDPARLLTVMRDESVTSIFLVPTQWQAVCDYPGTATQPLPRLRVLGWGAAPASDTLLRQMAVSFPQAQNVAFFGQTEMSPVTCVLHGKDAIRKLGSVGRPVASVTARVVDPEMNDVRPGDVGEIVYRGPGLMAGYWNKPKETAEAFRGGWFHSGDLVRVDDEGFVYVVDRAKDMIISGGENIYSVEVENVLAAHPDITEVAIVGEPHPAWGETPVAYVALRDPGAPLDIATLREWAAASLARYKLPTSLRVLPALPRNASGKVLKGVLRAGAPDA
jgi:fatty-acyl-CoA synthase